MIKLSFLLFSGFSFLSSLAFSARLKSFCLMHENSKEIIGQNIEERLPLASVSKVFTSLLAVSKNSVKRKIYTQFFITPFKNDIYDIHIKGAHEPYFGRQAMHWMIAKLNEAGVYRIRNLTFDQNFKYYHDTNRRARIGHKLIDPVSGKSDIEAPAPDLVKAQLEQNSAVMKHYDISVKEALSNGVQLPKKIEFKPEKVSFLDASLFVETSRMKKGYVASPELLHMLKLMNWTSNNHAANQIFQLGGGREEFNRLFYGKLGLQEKDVVFINGSGQNANLTGDGREYNEANCSTVVKTVRALSKALEIQNVKLQDAMSVVGGDIGSTVGGKTYNNETTNLSVIAKTGTVGTHITLAGMISAQKGKYYFYYNVELGSAGARTRNKSAWAKAEAVRARKIISNKLAIDIRKLGGPLKIDYSPQYFNLENFEDDQTDATNESEDSAAVR